MNEPIKANDSRKIKFKRPERRNSGHVTYLHPVRPNEHNFIKTTFVDMGFSEDEIIVPAPDDDPVVEVITIIDKGDTILNHLLSLENDFILDE